MKALFFNLLLMVAITAAAQENPWLPKGENPWKYFQEEEVQASPGENNAIALTDSTAPADTIQTKLAGKEESLQTTTLPVRHDAAPDTVLTLAEQKQLYALAGNDAAASYYGGTDFLAGFAFGLVFNVVAMPIADPVYVFTDNKNERETWKNVESKKVYQPLDDTELHRKVKSNIKGKKLASTLAGHLFGALAQSIIIISLL